MRLVLAVAGLLLGAAPVAAQYIPRPVVPIGPSSAQDAAEIVQAMGLDPIGPAARSGAFYIQRARDDFGRVLHVTVDARRSQVVAVEPGVPRGLYGPYAGYSPYGRPHYPPYPRGEAALNPPGSIIDGPMRPSHVAPVPPSAAVMPNVAPPPKAAPKPTQKAAAAPMPRKRPASAPHEAAGSVEPVAPQNSAPPPAPAPPNPTPPVTPLE